MLAITHFAVGLLIAVLFIVPVVGRLSESTVLVVSGLWALVPDVGWLSDSLWSNVFHLHGLMDWLGTGHPKIEAFIALVLLLVAVVIRERREIRSSPMVSGAIPRRCSEDDCDKFATRLLFMEAYCESCYWDEVEE